MLQCIVTYPNPFVQKGVQITDMFGEEKQYHIQSRVLSFNAQQNIHMTVMIWGVQIFDNSDKCEERTGTDLHT